MKFVHRVLFFLAVLIVQFTLFPRFWNIYLEPDLLLITLVLFALNKSPELACFLGFGLGLLIDVNTGDVLGSNAFVWTQIAMINASLRKYLLVESVPVQLAMTAASCLLASFIQFMLLRIALVDEPSGGFLFLAVSRAVITAIFTWPVSLLLSRFVFSTESGHA